MKLLKRKILFHLAQEMDFFKNSEGFKYYSYSFLYPRLFDFQSSSVRDAVLQLAIGGEIDKISRNKISFFRLTGKGREKLLSFFPLSIGQKKVWDRIWRLAVISKKTGRQKNDPKQMRKLRLLLRRLGFKKLSRGVYITPLPISEVLKKSLLEKNFSAEIALIESRRLVLGDNQQLAREIWKLDRFIFDYQNLVNQQKKLLKKIRSQKNPSDQDKKQFFLLLDRYFSLLEKDPGLPKKLLPIDWPQEKCQFLFSGLNTYFLEKKLK